MYFYLFIFLCSKYPFLLAKHTILLQQPHTVQNIFLQIMIPHRFPNVLKQLFHFWNTVFRFGMKGVIDVSGSSASAQNAVGARWTNTVVLC